MFRIFPKLAALTAVVVLSISSPAGATGGDLTFTGSGWGHGIGLSQYGARAMAARGATAVEILAHYFPGTTLRHLDTLDTEPELLSSDAPLWVGLLQDQSELTFRIEEGTADLCFDDTGPCVATATKGQRWKFGPDGYGLCNFSRQAGEGGYVRFEPSGECSASAQPILADTVLQVPRKGRSYRNGILRFRQSPTSGQLHLAIQLGIEDYVRGVQELPDGWPAAALEAQATVSRTLVVRHLIEHGPAAEFDAWRLELCACHLADDDPEQAFGGYTAELGRPFWQDRVGASAGEVVTLGDQVIWARFTSSTWGMTESNDAAGGEAYPYLISVDDSASFDVLAANPYATWVLEFDQGDLGSAFGFSWITDARVTSRNESRSAGSVVLSGIISGRPVTGDTTGAAVRDALGLHSSYFNIALSQRFADVSPSHSFSGEIFGLSELGITNGCTEITFCPDEAVSREQMAAFLVRSLGLEIWEGGTPLIDDDGSLFEAEIDTLYHHGITTGCTQTTFCPTEAVTRGQMAAFLIRVLAIR